MNVVTFYSFKGGVGRTMLASNVAGLLVAAGQRVLLVDFDLEAPGVTYLPEFRPGTGTSLPRGITGFLVDSWQAKQAQNIRRYLHYVPDFDGRLAILPAGDVDSDHFARDYRLLRDDRVIDFSVDDKHSEALLTLFDDLRQQWRGDFDYVLIDSRTGFTDVGGICTRVLPDLVVTILTLSRQGREGTKQVLQQVQPKSVYGVPVDVFVVASMVPTDLQDEVQSRLVTLAQDLAEQVDNILIVPLKLSLLLEEKPLYHRDRLQEGASDDLRLAYDRVVERIRARNEWDLEYRATQALNQIRQQDMVDREGGATTEVEDLLRSLMDDLWPVPVPRLLRAIEDVATAYCFPGIGSLATLEQRQLLAIAALRYALSQVEPYPDEHVRLLERLARILSFTTTESSNLVEAVELYRAALRITTPKKSRIREASLRTNLASTLRLLAAIDSSHSTDLSEAIALYRRALEILVPEKAPNEYVAILSNLANTLSTLPNNWPDHLAALREATDLYRRALSLLADDRNPRDRARLLESLANALRTLGETEPRDVQILREAVELYTASLEIGTRGRSERDEANIFQGRGEAYRLLGEYGVALADFERALHLNPRSAWPLASIGQVYRALKQYDQALSGLTHAFELEPDLVWVLQERSEVYTILGQYEAAMDDIANVIKMDGDNAAAWNRKGLLESYRGRYESAIESYQHALNLGLSEHTALYNIAVAMVRWKGTKSASTELEQAKAALNAIADTLHPDKSQAYYGLGGLRAVVGDEAGGLDYLGRAASLDETVLEWARDDIAWRDLRGNPRFEALLDKYGTPQLLGDQGV